MVSKEQKQYFDKCVTAALTGEHRREGIGTLGERTLHLILKNFFEPDDAYHEVKLGRYVADICRDAQIIEIQTRGFAALRKKLAAYRPDYKVTLVYPIADVKHISWIDPETGEISARRKSPKRGKAWDILYELYALRELMPLEGVRFALVFMNMDEFKLLSGKSRDKKHFGASRYERVPSELCDIVTLESPSDFEALVPPTLGEKFTAAEFAKAAKMTPRTAGYAIRTLVTLGVIERVETRGRAFVYARTALRE